MNFSIFNNIKNINFDYKSILIVSITMLFLDYLYLNYSKNFWGKLVKSIQGEEMNIRLISALTVYILMIIGLLYFIIIPKRSVKDAALLGFIVYGVFDLTNYALFKNYSIVAALMDMFWGSFLFAFTTYITYLFN